MNISVQSRTRWSSCAESPPVDYAQRDLRWADVQLAHVAEQQARCHPVGDQPTVAIRPHRPEPLVRALWIELQVEGRRLDAFCSSPVSLARLSVNVSAMPNSRIFPSELRSGGVTMSGRCSASGERDLHAGRSEQLAPSAQPSPGQGRRRTRANRRCWHVALGVRSLRRPGSPL